MSHCAASGPDRIKEAARAIDLLKTALGVSFAMSAQACSAACSAAALHVRRCGHRSLWLHSIRTFVCIQRRQGGSERIVLARHQQNRIALHPLRTVRQKCIPTGRHVGRGVIQPPHLMLLRELHEAIALRPGVAQDPARVDDAERLKELPEALLVDICGTPYAQSSLACSPRGKPCPAQSAAAPEGEQAGVSDQKLLLNSGKPPSRSELVRVVGPLRARRGRLQRTVLRAGMQKICYASCRSPHEVCRLLTGPHRASCGRRHCYGAPSPARRLLPWPHVPTPPAPATTPMGRDACGCGALQLRIAVVKILV